MLSTDQAQSVYARITQRVKRLPKGQPFSISRFTGFGTKNAVSKAIARLVKRGELERVYRGIYRGHAEIRGKFIHLECKPLL
ncbi:type IV toxin-antitoxin system AbiEi family antitoxin domain-containing protein [Pseudomonas aeruginosa]|uniref:DUF6088 family protein n=2 Tax=Pseudomonas aeruginosa TaxID=287 RepID=UPI00114E4BF1|nr:DUF6088 family protein [Pseudomonas aeruginosa]TQH28587.1 type IV toxin-antitoxin system AbiEi family antitoxin domain-containing protein [Pseudomonas aeruginosa]